MRNIWPRFLIYGLVVLLLAASFPAGALAGEKPAVSLEQAIRTVKVNFTIPKEYTRFTSSYTSDQDRRAWSLNWSAPEEPGGNFNARVDAQTGEILNMNTWKPERRPEPGLRIPTVSEAQARQTAGELLKRLISDRLPDLQPVSVEEQLIPLHGYGPFTYTFRWQRTVNGIPFPGNGVTVEVRAGDGQVAGYQLEWTKATLPPPAGAVSPAKARQAFDRAGMLGLQYFLPPSPRPLTAGEEQKQRVQLAYRLDHPSGGVINALSGEPLDLPGRWFPGAGSPGGEEMYRKMRDEQSTAPPPYP